MGALRDTAPRLILLGVLVAVALAVSQAVRADAAGGGADDPAVPLTAAGARTFPSFPLYWLGDGFEGLPLQAVTRRRDERPAGGRPIRADYVGFVYGDCDATGERGCAPPLEVQVWRACERSLGDYRATPDGRPLPSTATVVRGVPAAWFEDGLRLEVYTGAVTVVVFGDAPDRVWRAAVALRAVNGLASGGRMLPPPAAGALEGALDCAP